MGFKRGDKVRFLGKGACLASTHSSAAMYYSYATLLEGIDYTIESTDSDIIDDGIPIRLEGIPYYHPEDIFELVEEVYPDPMIEYDSHDRQVVDALNKTDIGTDKDDDDTYGHVASKDYKNLRVIFERDYKFYEELSGLIEYLRSTYGDKYEASEPNGFAPKELLTTEVCMFSVSKYLKRYNSEGFEKSRNKQDVMKSIHYLLMSLNINK